MKPIAPIAQHHIRATFRDVFPYPPRLVARGLVLALGPGAPQEPPVLLEWLATDLDDHGGIWCVRWAGYYADPAQRHRALSDVARTLGNPSTINLWTVTP